MRTQTLSTFQKKVTCDIVWKMYTKLVFLKVYKKEKDLCQPNL